MERGRQYAGLWLAALRRAVHRLLVVVRGIHPRTVYAISGVLSVVTGAVLTLWVLLPAALVDTPGGLNQAVISCAERGAVRGLGSLVSCPPADYKVTLLPDSRSEDVLVHIFADRTVSPARTYQLRWPGRAVGEARSTLPVTVESVGALDTTLRVDGRPVPCNCPYDRLVTHDSFTLRWRRAKERENFTDRRIRLSISSQPNLHDTGFTGDTINLEIGLSGSQSRIKDAPEASSRDIQPEAWTGRYVYQYRNASSVAMSYTEMRLRTLSVYALLASGVLLGVGVNLLTQYLVEYVGDRRRRTDRVW